MVTTTPKSQPKPPDAPHYEPDMPMAFGSELRLNLKALGVDGSAPDFGERLCQLSRDNEPYDFQFSAQGELIVMAPSGPLSNRDETVINVILEMYNRQQPGMCFSQTVDVPAPQRRQYLCPTRPGLLRNGSTICTELELRGAINGAPDFVVEVRSRSDRLPRCWQNGRVDGSRLPPGLDAGRY